MSDNGHAHLSLTDADSKSSIFKKTDADLRRRINRAIIDRDPPTYRGIFKRFDLAARGLSFTAFYYYARRIRMSAALAELTRARIAGGADPEAVLAEVLSDRLLEAALDPRTKPRALERFTLAYRAAAKLRLDRRRFDLQFDELVKSARAKETDRFCEMANQVGKLRAAELHELRARTAIAVERIKADPDYRDEELEEKLRDELDELDELDHDNDADDRPNEPK